MVWQWFSNLFGGAVNEVTDDVIYKMLKDKYTDNLLGVASMVKRMSFFGAMEVLMRATQGEAIERPLGTNLHLSPWEKVMFNPVHLHRMPVEDDATLDVSVVIGPKAEKPLKLDIPVIITGMSYGSALSRKVKLALAKAANQLGTATNTGESGLLPEERETANKLIGQFNRGGYLNTPDKYKQLDAVEIQLGQGAQGASPQRTAAKLIDDEMRQVYGLKENQEAVLHTRLPGVNSPGDFIRQVKEIKENTPVPVGVKIAASHFLEQELTIALEAGVDFLTVDGAEGATHGASPTLEDDLGLPTIYAVSRARRFLDKRDPDKRISLIASGGLFTPGQFLKAIALGADAVYTGTSAVLALMASQITKAAPLEPSTSLVLQSGKMKADFDIDKGAMSLGNFLRISVQEMMGVLYATGKPAVNQLNQEDLCCLNPFLARALQIPYAGVPQAEQENYFASFGIPPTALHRENEVYTTH